MIMILTATIDHLLGKPKRRENVLGFLSWRARYLKKNTSYSCNINFAGLEKDGSAVQNCYSSKRTRFNSQHPYSGSQPSVTPASADPNSC